MTPPFVPYLMVWYLKRCLLLWTAIACPLAQAGEVTAATVEYADGRFTVHTDILIQAPAAAVRAVLLRFENLPKINPGIKEVQILERPAPDRLRMRVESRVCMLWRLCLRYRWVQEVSLLPSGDIMTRIDPEVSDFRDGWVRYQLLPVGERTRLQVDGQLVPDFWFPPLIGPLLIKNRLREEALETASALERWANPEAGKAAGAPPQGSRDRRAE